MVKENTLGLHPHSKRHWCRHMHIVKLSTSSTKCLIVVRLMLWPHHLTILILPLFLQPLNCLNIVIENKYSLFRVLCLHHLPFPMCPSRFSLGITTSKTFSFSYLFLENSTNSTFDQACH